MNSVQTSNDEFIKKSIIELNKNIEYAETLQYDQLELILRYSEKRYYNIKDENVSNERLQDAIYDPLKQQFNEMRIERGETIDDLDHIPENDERMIELPIRMGSCTKVNHGTGQLLTWLRKYKGPFMLSAKMDGVSALFMKQNGQLKIFSRGKGNKGQDISEILNYVEMPDLKDGYMVRGEFIIKKNIFDSLFKRNDDKDAEVSANNSERFKNARNAVAGVVNTLGARAVKGTKASEHELSQMKIDLMNNLDFVPYELIDIEYEKKNAGKMMKYSKQYQYLSMLFPNTMVRHEICEELYEEDLYSMFDKYLTEMDYEIDGIVICDDDPNTNYIRSTTKNPEHSRAYKKVLDNEKPVVNFEPRFLDNVTISAASGYNAKYISENSIGPGSIIKITRSGGVIPKIIEIIKKSDEPQMPETNYVWNESGVEIIFEYQDDNPFSEERRPQNIKKLHHFLVKIGTKGLGEKNVGKMYDGGIRTICDIITIKRDELTMFQEKTGDNIYKTISENVAKMSLGDLLVGSSVFGRLFSTKRIVLLLDFYPNFFFIDEVINDDVDEIAKLVMKIEGFAKKTSEEFAEKVKEAISFLDDLEANGIDIHRLKQGKILGGADIPDDNIQKVQKLKGNNNNNNEDEEVEPVKKKPISEDEAKNREYLIGLNVICTGFRDLKIADFLKENGATVQANVTKKTNLIIVKDLKTSNKKTEAAQEKGIAILTKEEFVKKCMRF